MSSTPRRLLASSLAVLLVIPVSAVAAGAATDESPTATGSDDAAAQQVRPGAGDDDGLDVRDRELTLTSAPRTIDLPDRPEMLILDEVEVGTELAIRSRNDGVWSEWTHLHVEDDDRPDGLPGGEGAQDTSAGVGPVWLGHGADRVQIERHEGDDDRIRVESLSVLDTPAAAAEGPQGFRSSAPASAPFIRGRSSWATSGMGWSSNSGCGSGPSATADIKAMVVHHTAGRNDYSSADVPAILRGIWYYHVQSRGWCDVAYNFFVDRFGGVWEGRQGGVNKPIVGGHTFGHNSETTGVAQLGNFDTTGAPSAMTASTAKLIGWKLGVHNVDPSGRSRLTNKSSSTTPAGLKPGASVDVPSVLGHRDLGSTACPGGSTYARLGGMRSTAQPGAHVVVLHRTFLGTVPNDGQYAGWLGFARTYGIEATSRAMSRSNEFAGPMIDDLYERVLGRTPDPAGRAYWLDKVQKGMGLRDISIGFYASLERYRKSGNTPETYVRAHYKDILHREPDAGGLRYWSQRLRAGESRTVISGGFFGSVESRADRVNRLYQTILGRDTDPTGTRSWSEFLVRNDDLDLAAILTGSLEYYRRNLT